MLVPDDVITRPERKSFIVRMILLKQAMSHCFVSFEKAKYMVTHFTSFE